MGPVVCLYDVGKDLSKKWDWSWPYRVRGQLCKDLVEEYTGRRQSRYPDCEVGGYSRLEENQD